jgi:hypothetical protein
MSQELKSFDDLKIPNHPIRKIMKDYSETVLTERKNLLIATLDNGQKICFIGETQIKSYIMYYDYLNSQKCENPYDRHTTCLNLTEMKTEKLNSHDLSILWKYYCKSDNVIDKNLD